ncbi:prefoldin subunit 3-like [Pollicipes pollicipes]|uniref:prefoldin subunit 3-like n=1 Tax=Pollicipes pollicipes TaxID=41117 RepID=UPI0018854063|nr:prefoldin subunit 3-like [Pollicipes pollicipes]XP_037082712.1 prefoldin subunit 3-like [Pollicipes pollicipes]XP_037082713.1 prefoldin subunit 3-like [Pollicipes pollicipes]XP_037082715.1 prefoldin subunit 3-like [Pollicipes pollicipes]XP_037082716.1 prefoldin subunit 3-like [Pollicipes pollicipes]
MSGDQKTPKSFAGIPEAQFLEDVDSFMKEQGSDVTVEKILKQLEEQHQKYKFMELNLTSKRKRLKSQIPDIEGSLKIVRQMQEQKGTEGVISSHFLLSDQVYAKAESKPSDSVCLWLGANVMLEYSLDDANTLLSENLNNAQKNLSQVDHDLDFLRDQFTTVEVNMARVYNWDVKKRQAAKAAGATL